MKRISSGDLLLVCGVLLLALALFAWRSFSRRDVELEAVLRVGGEEVRRFSLSGEAPGVEYSLIGRAGGEILIRGEGGRIRVLRSDCPDGHCVRTGWIEHQGEAAVCLPNRLVLKVVGPHSDGVADELAAASGTVLTGIGGIGAGPAGARK